MVAVETIVTSAGVSLVVSLAAFEYRHRRERSYEDRQEIESWYAETAELARQVQQTWRRKYKRPSENGAFADFDEIKKEMNLYASQLSSHASGSADLEVDQSVVDDLEETADYCRDLYDTRISVGSGAEEFDEVGEKVVGKAEELQEEALKHIS
ncbi:hypothetical protein [Haloterrigena salinisoli]|uniref:hypothetical protein n=1 Tax=Haloterrigena salinisoli TaxID=3132747 RepID=UPI0030CE2863